LILDKLKPDMSENWVVVDDGIYFIQYAEEKGTIVFYDFATQRVKEIAKLGRHHILT